MQDLEKIQKKIKYKFKHTNLLKMALTHSSFVNEHKESQGSYERLEFLGDAILGFIVNEKIYSLFPNEDEGFMSKLKASVVCEPTLAKFSRELGYREAILMGQSEMQAGGMNRDSVLCDCFESVLAAIYLDSDFENARSWVNSIITEDIYFSDDFRTEDYKTLFQEKIQKSGANVSYKIISQSGPDHNKVFEAEVYVNNKAVARGTGTSKKGAEQNAAENALKN